MKVVRVMSKESDILALEHRTATTRFSLHVRLLQRQPTRCERTGCERFHCGGTLSSSSQSSDREDMDCIKEDATLNEEDISPLDFLECSNMSIAPL